MRLDFRPTTERDAAALSGFLRRMLQLGAGASIVAEPHMRWKYWSPREDWPGPRGFTARCDGTIVAHAAVWPARVRVPDRIVRAAHVIDWAADPAYPGAGTSIMRYIAKHVGLLIATGGSEITRRILPVIGFRPHGEVECFARPLRPLAQAVTTEQKSWRLPARVLRNSYWRLSTPVSFPRGWRVRRLAPEEIPQKLWPRASHATAVTVRDAGLYRYVVDSPSTRHALFGLEKQGELVGYFCLAFAAHSARIADFWLPSRDLDDWHTGFQTAAAVSSEEPDVYEVSAWASTALGKEALARAGFRSRERQPVSFLGDARILDGLDLHVQMLDCDASFLAAEAVAYLT